VIGDDVDRLLGEVVDDGEALHASTVGQRVHHEVHRPHLIRRARDYERLAVDRNSSPASPTAHRQARLSV